DHQPALNRDMIAHLGTGAFLAKASNVVLLGPPGTGKTHLAIGSDCSSGEVNPERAVVVGQVPHQLITRRQRRAGLELLA
ncbi:hypothetical protein C6A85_07770, partial [Mycobacterium sp. ITM-2017-0098]